MANTPEIQELSIVLAAPNHNSTLLTPDFLAGSGIIPTDWELSRPPVLTARASQVAFKSSVSFIAQPGTLTISESLNNKSIDEIQVAAITLKYAQALSNLTYQTTSINIKHLLPFDNIPNGARKFIHTQLLMPGDWQQLGDEPMQAAIALVYPLGEKQLRLNITEARLKGAGEETVPVVMLSGNFNYPIEGDTPEVRLKNLSQALENWKADVETFQTLIETKFKPKAANNSEIPVPQVV